MTTRTKTDWQSTGSGRHCPAQGFTHLWVALCLACVFLTAGCGAWGVRSAVSLKLTRTESAPRDASVTIDEEFIGLLGVVAARGVRLPKGEHRITIERKGYFPWDEIVVSDRQPIQLRVEMVRIPD